MSYDERIPSEELAGGYRPAEAPSDFRLPTDVLLAVRPFGHKMITEGVPKPFDAVECYAIEVTEDGYSDLGLRDCAWQFVIRELDKASDESPWVVGTIVKKARAYFFTPPTPEEAKMAGVAIEELVMARQLEESAEEPF